MWFLFEALESLVKLAYMVWKLWMGKTRRLGHVYILYDMSMHKSILYVNLLDMPPTRDNKRENCAYCGRLNDGVKVSPKSRPCYL